MIEEAVEVARHWQEAQSRRTAPPAGIAGGRATTVRRYVRAVTRRGYNYVGRDDRPRR